MKDLYTLYRFLLALYGGPQIDKGYPWGAEKCVAFEDLIYIFPDSLMDHIIEYYDIGIDNHDHKLVITINLTT